MDSPTGQQAPKMFSRWATNAARTLGSAKAFVLALGIVLLWALSGPVLRFDTWQLIINTGTTIVTFLMVILVQHTQNRDSAAIQLKLDEMIRSTQGAHNALLDLGELGTEDLEKIRALYEALAQKARADTIEDLAAQGTPDIPLSVLEGSRQHQRHSPSSKLRNSRSIPG
jgi:low affinity Fe/Cu permease